MKPALPPSTSAKAREDVAGEDDARRRELLKKLLRGHTGKRFKRPRLRTVLLLINLVVLVLPLAGIAMLRIYESALIRQTESELVAQGTVISATYQALLQRLAAAHKTAGVADYGIPVEFPLPLRNDDGETFSPWRPRPLQLDLARDPILPKPPEPDAPNSPSDPLALEIGRLIEPILRTAQFTTLAGIRVVDFRGTIVASTFDRELRRSMLGFVEIARALRGEPVSTLRSRYDAGSGNRPPPPLASISRGTQVRVFVAVPIVIDSKVVGAVLLVRTPASLQQALLGKRTELLHGTLLLIAVVLALSLLTSFTISRPVRALIEQTRRAARGEQGAVVPLRRPGTYEIGELSDTIAVMAATLEARATYIRDFAAHVSHEFKTPLTAIQGSVELLREHGNAMSDDERSRFLNILADDSERLERLVQRLLELARADMTQPGDEHAAVRPTVIAVAERFRERGLPVHCDFAFDAEVPMAVETLDAVVATVLDNARQHAGPDVQVLVQVGLDDRPDTLKIDIVDDGIGITAANAPKIFEPFFTTGRPRGSTGLGLPIIRSLLAAHGGSIALVPAGRGAHFRIRLPHLALR